MGILGIVVLILARLGARSCGETVGSIETIAWFVSAAVLVVAVLVVGSLAVPVASGQRILRNVARPFWTSPGSPATPGRNGGMVLLVFGMLELLDLAFRPETLSHLQTVLGSEVGSLGALLAAFAVLIVVGPILPEFTTAVVGLAAGLFNAVLLFVHPDPCTDSRLLLAVVAGFVALSSVSRRFG